jgi:hypothetical protein
VSLATKTIIIAVVVAALAMWAALSMPIPASWQGTAQDFYLPLLSAIIMAATHLSAGALFLLGLPAYKAKLKFAYGAISVGVICTAIGSMQVPIISAFNLTDTFWVRSGIVILPFLLSGLAIYIGVRGFAKLIAIKTKLLNTSVIIPCVILLSVLSSFLPHGPTASTELVNDISNGILMWTGLLYLVSLFITLKIRAKVGSHYTNAVAWLAVALFGGMLIVAVAMFNTFVLYTADQFNAAIDVLSAINGAVFVKAGLAFNKTRDY